MKAIISNKHKYFLGADNNQNIDFLAQRWAKKYVHNLQIDAEDYANNDQMNLTDIVSQAGREKTTQVQTRVIASVQDSETNCQRQSLELRCDRSDRSEVKRHRIDPNLINTSGNCRIFC